MMEDGKGVTWLLWCRGPLDEGVVCVKLMDRGNEDPRLTPTERNMALAPPVLVDRRFAGLPVRVLAEAYPLPDVLRRGLT